MTRHPNHGREAEHMLTILTVPLEDGTGRPLELKTHPRFLTEKARSQSIRKTNMTCSAT
jgi:hypothetical protein